MNRERDQLEVTVELLAECARYLTGDKTLRELPRLRNEVLMFLAGYGYPGYHLKQKRLELMERLSDRGEEHSCDKALMQESERE